MFQLQRRGMLHRGPWSVTRSSGILMLTRFAPARIGPVCLLLSAACIPHRTRITLALLEQRKAKVTPFTVVKRKRVIVHMAALDALPEYPLDLEKWVIPKSTPMAF